VQIIGEVADEEAGLRAEEAVQPLRDWQNACRRKHTAAAFRRQRL